VDLLTPEYLQHLIATYGYVAVGVVIALESMGLPLPGETVLILAALYAGQHNMSLAGVVASAALGAVIGDNIGYWIGREFGYRLLLRHGGYIGLTPSKIKLGQYLFLRHGAKVVFFGRFIAILRVLAARGSEPDELAQLSCRQRRRWHRLGGNHRCLRVRLRQSGTARNRTARRRAHRHWPRHHPYCHSLCTRPRGGARG
jgi:membrane protein YqaA with SNARE-associated domain